MDDLDESRNIFQQSLRRAQAALAELPSDDPAPETPIVKAIEEALEPRQPQEGSADVGRAVGLGDQITAEDFFAKDAGGHLHVFALGVYRPLGENFIERQVKLLTRSNGRARPWSSRLASEVVKFIRVDAPLLQERPPLNIINMANGLLEWQTRVLLPHDPQFRSCVQIPVRYDPEAACPEWEAFIGEVFPADCQTLAYEIIAWLLCPDTTIQKAILLQGDGENGKSTFLSGVTALLGPENVAGVSLHKLETDRFSTASLIGKLANFCADLPSEHLASTSMFKAVVGGDRVFAERKYFAPFEFLPFCRLLFSANHFPQSKDSSYAFFRRWEVVPFTRTITTAQKSAKPDILARLTTSVELSGLLNRCLDVLPALRQRQGFMPTETTASARQEYQENTDPLAVWIDRNTVLDPSGVVTKKDLFVKYSAESAEAGRPITPARTFYLAVKRLRPTLQETMRRVNGNPRDVFVGLAFRQNEGVGVVPVSDVSGTPTPPIAGEKREEKGGGMEASAYRAYAPYGTTETNTTQVTPVPSDEVVDVD